MANYLCFVLYYHLYYPFKNNNTSSIRKKDHPTNLPSFALLKHPHNHPSFCSGISVILHNSFNHLKHPVKDNRHVRIWLEPMRGRNRSTRRSQWMDLLSMAWAKRGNQWRTQSCAQNTRAMKTLKIFPVAWIGAVTSLSCDDIPWMPARSLFNMWKVREAAQKKHDRGRHTLTRQGDLRNWQRVHGRVVTLIGATLDSFTENTLSNHAKPLDMTGTSRKCTSPRWTWLRLHLIYHLLSIC